MRLVFAALALAATLLLAGCGGSKEAAETTEKVVYRGGLLTPPTPAVPFTLKDARGKEVSLEKTPGHWVILTFLYTQCPDVCPLIANNLDLVLATNIAKDADLEVLAVSVDPKNDTPAAVRRYERDHRLSRDFKYLIGSRKELEPVWRAYHVAAQPKKGGISHTAFEILIDPSGKQRMIYFANSVPTDFITDLAQLTGNTG